MTDKKKGIRQLLIAAGILLVLGTALYFFTPFAATMRSSYYIIAPAIMLQLFLLPIFWLVLGWAVMQLFGILGVVIPGRSKLSKPVRIIVLTIVLLYAALMLPLFIDQINPLIQSLRFPHNSSPSPDGSQLSSIIPEFLSGIEWRVTNTVYAHPMMFIIPGIIFWLSKPMKKRDIPTSA